MAAVLDSRDPDGILAWIKGLTGILGFEDQASDYEWSFVSKLPLTDLYDQPIMGMTLSPEEWAAYRNDERRRYLSDCYDSEERRETAAEMQRWSAEYRATPEMWPIIAIHSDDVPPKIEVKDGAHRIAEAAYLKWETIPAVVGVPKTAKRSASDSP